MTTAIKTTACIIGGGLTGLTLAYSLSRLKIRSVIIDPRNYNSKNAFKIDGRCSAIAAGSKNFFEKINIWQDFNNHAEPILDIRVSDGNSKSHLHYSHKLVGDEAMGYMVNNSTMLEALYGKIKQSEFVTILEERKCISYDFDANKVTINLSDNSKIESQILFACDGKFSKVRDLANIETVRYDYKQTGIVCTVKHEKHHQNLAHERFLKAGPFAVLPMHGGYHSSLVWTEPDNLAKIYLKLSDEDFLDQISNRFGGYFGKLSLQSERFSYPLTLTHAKQYVKNRLVLVGDAAHAIHPLAGQGFNLGIRDIESLTTILDYESKIGTDLGDSKVIKQYEAARKIDSHSLIAITTGLNIIFANDNILIKSARRIGMNTINKLPIIKKSLMKHAMGL